MRANNRLRKNKDFRLIYKTGRSMANRFLIIYLKKNLMEDNRVGFTVSKKVGKSVVRSRVKRLMKESYRLNEKSILKGYDIVFVARASCSGTNYKEIQSALLHLLRKMNLVIKN